ncbi:serine threonine protein kinase : Putative serine/threonine protein kinase OS=Gemmata sp. Wa1-1 PE=3 SV=1: Pkinase [Gemmata massiliana]|uniref:Protein kinase domain-containing protein n=2 Tax=Gemmata massiliana TaxID=1210884 RepID=A0A6P2CTE1_9BACT|nr:serine threonine protein kinase : Putative serine/threonine protein kinase OS=Gemmata sp. Wa1-1 PE=3 SV=1: Pkinase [Gemmata massiliana]
MRAAPATVVRNEMGTPTDPTGRPSSAKIAGSVPSSGEPAPPPKKEGSTDSHRPTSSLSELIQSNGSSRTRTNESDIAQFLAHPQGGAANSDDAPTVITHNAKQPQPVPTVPLTVTGEPPSIAGRRLGHFELIEAIGSGGMAAVLKARDLELGRIVALKILPPEAARDPESVTRFKQEARSAAKLDHENVARVYFCGEDQGLNFIAFEFVEGDNLRVIIDRRGQLPPGECVRYMMQVAAGLNHAGERGVVHRDIKPSNILITPDGRAKIVDMGLARYLGSELVNGTVTQSGVTLGTFDYISPEQALDPRRADVRSDIYSLGCTFYHALTGRPPVPEGTAARKLRAHQEDDFLDPRELNPAISDELAAVLARMMMKSPGARYQTPNELISHLKGLAERLHVADPLAHDSATKAVPAELRLLPQTPRIRPWWVLAVVAVALAVVAFLVSTGDPGPAPGIPGLASTQPKDKDHKDKKGGDSGTQPTPPVPLPAATGPVQTIEELAKRLEDPNTTEVELAPRSFDLSALPQGISFQGSSLKLVGARNGTTRIIVTPGSASARIAGAGAVAISDVWFEFRHDEHLSLVASGAPTGLQVDDVTKIEFTDCAFVPDSSQVSQNHETRAVVVTRATTTTAVTRCLFAPGVVGLELPAGSQATITDSGFAPHATAAVQVTKAGGSEPAVRSVISIKRSSFMLNPGGTAIEVEAATVVPADAPGVSVAASDSLFALVGGKELRPPFGTLDLVKYGTVTRVRGERLGLEKLKDVRFSVEPGRANAFYRVHPIGTLKSSFSFEECKGLPDFSTAEKSRSELAQSPWSDQSPITTVVSNTPHKAFRLHVETDRALFMENKGETTEPFGAVFHVKDGKNGPLAGARRLAYSDITFWPPPRPIAPSKLAEKIWYPSAEAGTKLAPGEFTSLRTLLREVRPGDTILIRHNGVLQVDGEELKAATKPSEGELRVTFKPYPGCEFFLRSQGDEEVDQSLFKLKSGEVTFDGIHFALKPSRLKNEVTAAVAVFGGRSCTFKNCTFTLSEKDDAQVAAVYLPNLKPVMEMDPGARPVPRVVFDHCVIRGRGRGVWVEVTRPLNLEMTDTLTALDGPVLLSEAGGKPVATSASAARFVRVTALVAGPIVEMRGAKAADTMRTAGLTRLDVEADECLFVAVPLAGRALVELDGVEPIDWNSVLRWQVKKPNLYANFEATAAVAQIRPPHGEGTAKEWSWDDWIGNVGEPTSVAGKRLGKVTFAAPPTVKELAAVKPADVAVKDADFPATLDSKLIGSKLVEAGADPKELPTAPDEMKPDLE